MVAELGPARDEVYQTEEQRMRAEAPKEIKAEREAKLLQEFRTKVKQETVQMFLPYIAPEHDATIDPHRRELAEQALADVIDAFIADYDAARPDALRQALDSENPTQFLGAHYDKITTSIDRALRTMYAPGYRREIGQHHRGVPVFQKIHESDEEFFALVASLRPSPKSSGSESAVPNQVSYILLDRSGKRPNPSQGAIRSDSLPATEMNLTDFFTAHPRFAERFAAYNRALQANREQALFRQNMRPETVVTVSPEALADVKGRVTLQSAKREKATTESKQLEEVRRIIVESEQPKPEIVEPKAEPLPTPPPAPVKQSPLTRLLSAIGIGRR